MKARAIRRPGGTLVVAWRRTGVEPSAGLAVGLIIWAITRLRWQLGEARTWSVEVYAPGRFTWLLNRKVHATTVSSRPEAKSAAQELSVRVEAGDFDRYLQPG